MVEHGETEFAGARRTATGSGRAAVVIGMHRSGTSVLARVASLCGYTLPADLMQPHPDNPKGFWEPLSVVRLNNGILKELGAAWDRPGPFLCHRKTLAESERIVSEFVQAKYRARAVNALKRSFRLAPRIVLKDPRVTLLLPLWMTALAELGYAPNLTVIYRHPLEVAESIRQRNRMALRQGMQLWFYYNLCCLRESLRSRDGARLVSYHAMLEDPLATISQAFGAEMLDSLDFDTRHQIRSFVTGSDNHHANAGMGLADAPNIAKAIRDMWALLDEWNKLEAGPRADTVAKLGEAFNEAMLFAGKLIRPSAAVETAVSPPAERKGQRSAALGEGAALADRKQGVRILHYHLFKNAGTSVDEMLKRNFGAHWAEQEFPASGGRSNAALVGEFLKARPELLALSSHTALLPVPELDGERIIPIMFLRHPIMRISSAYEFERNQNADNFSAQLAKETNFAGYVRGHLDHPQHRGLKNFQTFRLALNEPESSESELSCALRAVRTLPFIGLVEAYDASVKRFEQLVKPYFPHFTAIIVRKNVTRAGSGTIDDELANVRQRLGQALYDELIQKNQDDLDLFNEVKKLYSA